ncbi:hypothetical protein BJ741DRAFT_619317, partial [Chytriomyces cf. hyalinus JEL632]
MSVNRLEALMLDIDSSLGRLEDEEEPSDLASPLSPAGADPDKKACTVNELLDTSMLSGTLHWVPPIHQHNFKTESNSAASLPIRRFFILSTNALFMFASSAPTEQCLDVFKLSESLLMIANIQAVVTLPLAFEIRDESHSWILCAQTKTSKSLWMEMIHVVISKLPDKIHGELIPNVALDSSISIGSGSNDLLPAGLPLSPQHAYPPPSESQHNLDYAAYTLNQDSALITASTRQSLPPYSLLERVNGSFINAGFGVSENNDGAVSPIIPNSRMDLSRGGSASGTTSAPTLTGPVARKKKKPYMIGFDVDLLVNHRK